MQIAFKYRVYPTRHQQEILQKTFSCCRYVYNRVLADKKDKYDRTGKSPSINSYITQLPVWKKELDWLGEVDAVALQQSLRNLDKAYANFFRNTGKVGFPKFKSKNNNFKSYRTIQASIFNEKRIKLPKLGVVKAKISKPIKGRILSATISQTPSGKYYVSFCCDNAEPSEVLEPSVAMLGIDAGIKNIATCSNGEKLSNPHSLKKGEIRLKRAQRKLSRKKKGSRNRTKQRVRVARIHEHITNQRKDTLHKFTTYAVCESQAIAVEDLHIKGMQNNHHLAKAVGDASMSEMIRQLEYKSDWYGRRFVKVGRFYPSSKTCSDCGYVYNELTLAEREWKCPKCGKQHDRDLNAALNIALEGKRLLKGTAGLAGTAA